MLKWIDLTKNIIEMLDGYLLVISLRYHMFSSESQVYNIE